jgi:leucyl-tRNA synthetase
VIWTEEGVQGTWKFVNRLWRLVCEMAALAAPANTPWPMEISNAAVEIRKAAHASLLKVTEDIERLRFNRAVAQVHDLVNKLSAAVGAIESPEIGLDMACAFREAAEITAKIMAPMMPHLAEECWVRLGHANSISTAAWPEADASLVIEATLNLPVQVNGKKRADVTVAREANAAEIEAAALALEPVQRALEGRPVKKIIIVPQRIINVVA